MYKELEAEQDSREVTMAQLQDAISPCDHFGTFHHQGDHIENIESQPLAPSIGGVDKDNNDSTAAAKMVNKSVAVSDPVSSESKHQLGCCAFCYFPQGGTGRVGWYCRNM